MAIRLLLVCDRCGRTATAGELGATITKGEGREELWRAARRRGWRARLAKGGTEPHVCPNCLAP